MRPNEKKLKAAQQRRTPKRDRNIRCFFSRFVLWSAPVLRRFQFSFSLNSLGDAVSV
jgi:hypothetical protein